jgi:hypothetical protein
MKSPAGRELARLSVISQEYSLLQIVKLHDKAAIKGKVTLGIDYVLTYDGWSDSVRDSLGELARKLGDFADQLRGARNKVLSHNDLATIAAGATLGEFADGDDVEYFKALQDFVNTVHDQVLGGPYQFNDLVKGDIADFLITIKP